MQTSHSTRIDARYWTAITLASVFGTNLGDLYAHESGLGIWRGLGVLLAVALAALAVERTDRRVHEVYYWLVIIVIRTGATNIADALAFRVRIPGIVLVPGLAAVIALAGWLSMRAASARSAIPVGRHDRSDLPTTNAAYWVAMLGAGVFGTVLGDICSHAIGQGSASLVLLTTLSVGLWAWHRAGAGSAAIYWIAVACARTAGTTLGDWLAENKTLHIGLPLSTLMTGGAFVAVLVAWRSAGPRPRVVSP